MCQPNNASMEEVYKAEVECLRRQLAEKDEEIRHLKDLLNVYDKEQEIKTKVVWTEFKFDDSHEKALRKAQ